MPTCIRGSGKEFETKCLTASLPEYIKRGMSDERVEEPILKFRKRPEEEEAESTQAAAPAPEKRREGESADFHWEITLTPSLLTTNTGMVELTQRIQKLIEEIVRGIMRDKGTPISHPVIVGYINMHGACEQIKAVFRPQQVQMTPQQIAELQRQMGQGRA